MYLMEGERESSAEKLASCPVMALVLNDLFQADIERSASKTSGLRQICDTHPDLGEEGAVTLASLLNVFFGFRARGGDSPVGVG